VFRCCGKASEWAHPIILVGWGLTWNSESQVLGPSICDNWFKKVHFGTFNGSSLLLSQVRQQSMRGQFSSSTNNSGTLIWLTGYSDIMKYQQWMTLIFKQINPVLIRNETGTLDYCVKRD